MTEAVDVSNKGITMKLNWKTIAIVLVLMFGSGTGGSAIVQVASDWIGPTSGAGFGMQQLSSLEKKVAEIEAHDVKVHEKLVEIQTTQVRLVTLHEAMEKRLDRVLDERGSRRVGAD